MSESSSSPSGDLLVELSTCVAGLTYPSESDEPFDVINWKATEADAVKQLVGEGRKIAPMKETSLDDFFAEIIAGEDGEKYRMLRKILESRLSGIRVLRAGEVEVDVYLIGKTAAGGWAGVHTMSVET